MPNGRHTRTEQEEELVESIEEEGWNYYPDPPDWILEKAESDGLNQASGGFDVRRETFYGDNYIYLVTQTIFPEHAEHEGPHVFSQKKSEYFETTPEEGTCPNCQEYIRRYEEDEYLTCHRCGWQYRPLTERARNLLSKTALFNSKRQR